MESVRDLVFFSPRRPPKMHDLSSAFFPARKVGASPSTLKVYVAAIAAHHDAVDGRSLGKDESLQVSPCALLGPRYRPGWTSEGPLWAAGLSRAKVPVS